MKGTRVSSKTVDQNEFRKLYLEGMSYEDLSSHFRITIRYARVLRDRLGLPKRNVGIPQRATPSDFAEFVEAHGIAKAQSHFRAGWGTVYRWCDELGIPRTRRKPTKTRPKYTVETPDDWAEVAPTMYKNQLTKHYGISMLQVTRLIEKTGIRAKLTVHELAAMNGRKAKAAGRGRDKHQSVKWLHWRARAPSQPQRDVYDLAAGFLRRTFSNVFRCDILLYEGKRTTWGDEHGLPHHGRYHYCVGKLGPLERDNMLSVAEQRGFTVDPITLQVAA